MRAAQALRKRVEERRKHRSETSEERHQDNLWHERMERAQLKAEELLPEYSPQLQRISEHLHECCKLMTEGLEHKL